MRNHEVGLNDRNNSPLYSDQDRPPEAYDARGGGSVTRVVLDATTPALQEPPYVPPVGPIGGSAAGAAGATNAALIAAATLGVSAVNRRRSENSAQ